MKIIIKLILPLFFFSCTLSQTKNSNKNNIESPLKGIKKVTTIDYNAKIIDGDTIIEFPQNGVSIIEYDEDGYLSKLIFSMSLKNKIPIYHIGYKGDNLSNLNSALEDSLKSKNFQPKEYLDFTNGKFDTTNYTFNKIVKNQAFMKGSDGSMEIWEINGEYIITPNPMFPQQPNIIKKYNNNGEIISEAVFGFQEAYLTTYQIIKRDKFGKPSEGIATIKTYQSIIINDKIKILDFSDLKPSKERIRYSKFIYEM